MQDFEGRTKVEFLRQAVTCFLQGEIKKACPFNCPPHKSRHIFQLGKSSVSPIKIPSHPTFEIPHLFVWTPGRMNPENSGASFRKRFSAGVWVVEATSECGLEKVEIRGHALGLEEGLSETKPSCPLPIPAFSVFPDFVVFPASWSGGDASHTSALNTSSTHLLRGFRTFFRLLSSYTNPDLSLISHTEYRCHSRTCMASNYGSDIVDQYIVNTHFLADKFCHIFCIFNTIPMCDHDNIIIPAL